MVGDRVKEDREKGGKGWITSRKERDCFHVRDMLK